MARKQEDDGRCGACYKADKMPSVPSAGQVPPVMVPPADVVADGAYANNRDVVADGGYANNSDRGGPASSSAREKQPCQRTRTRSPRQAHTEMVTDRVDKIDQELENLRSHIQQVRALVIEGPQP